MTKKKARPAEDMNTFAQDVQDAHHEAERSDHGRTEPRRERIPLTEARHLDNVEHLIPKGYVGRWVLTKEIEKFKQAWYEFAQGNPTRASGADKLHLMIIKDEYHQEDQEIAHKKAKMALGDEIQLGENEYTDNKSGTAIDGHVSDNPFT